MAITTFLLIASLVTAASAGPTGSRTLECSTKCEGDSKFSYETGHKYEYIYETETTTSLTGVTDEASSIKVSAVAVIQPVTQCEYILSLQNVVLTDSSKSGSFQSAVSRIPLRFSVQNGRVQHVCASSDEPNWVVNFKKGVLSTFQNSMSNYEENEVLTETDVSGICETSYSSKREDMNVVITRTKKPSECANSPQIQKKLSSFGYSFDSLIQSLPVITSDQKCTQIISDELIKEVTCEETHEFIPFSQNKNSGAQTKSTTYLKLQAVRTASSPFLESFGNRNELIFDYSETSVEESFLVETETLLSQLRILTENGVKKEVPGKFSDLVKSMKGLTHPQIIGLYEKSPSRVRSFIIDALPMVGNAEAIGAYVDLIINGEISDKEMDAWVTSLAFIKNPTLEMFSAILPLLENVKSNHMLLGVSSLVHNYCLKNGDCEMKSDVKSILRNFESRLGIGCRETSDEEKANILFALKAIGNAGRFVYAEPILRTCYVEENSMEVRLAAIDAWRRTPCSYDRDHLLKTFIEQGQDNEIRIASYLALMKCPTQKLIDTLRDRLTSEGVNHVESFVWTHLTNLQESAASEKQWIRHLIGEDMLKKKFSPSAVKLSRNYESSFYLEEQEIGASVDSNMILSGKSIFPRSSMLNLTIDLFGESINLFEVGGRIEGFESYVENFFGPNGYYPEETVAAIIKNFRSENVHGENNLQAILPKLSDEPKGSVYLKLLGNELFYRSFRGIEDSLPEISFSSILDSIMKLASEGAVDFTKSYNLIDSEFIFPTISGFPLNLNLNGMATVGVKLNGNFDLKDFTSFSVEGMLHPSAAVKIDASMSVDAFVTESGVSLVSNLHSSTSIKGNAVVNGGKLIDFTINTPEEKVDIFSMTNQFFKNDKGKVEKIETPENSYSIDNCKPIFCKAIGMEICFSKTISNVCRMIPCSPFDMQVFLRKTDAHSAYVFHYSRKPEKTTVLFDIAGSESDKRWSASISYKSDAYEVDIHSPHGSISAILSHELQNGELEINTEISMNNMKKYGTKFHVSKITNEQQFTIEVELLLKYLSENKELINIRGEAEYNRVTKSIYSNASMQGLLVPSFGAKFNFERREENTALSIDVTSDPLDLSVSGAYRYRDLASDKGSISLAGKYRLYRNPIKRLTANVEYKNWMDGVDNHFSGSAEIQEINFLTNVALKMSTAAFESKIDGKLDAISWHLENSFSYINTPEALELTYKHYSKIPSVSRELFIENHFIMTNEKIVKVKTVQFGEHESKGKFEWNYGRNFLLEVGQYTEGRTEFSMNLGIQKLAQGSYTIEYSSSDNKHKKNFEGSLKATTEDFFQSEVKGIYSDGLGDEYNLLWTLDANQSELKSEMNFNCSGKECFFLVSADRSSISIDTNFPKLFKAEVKILDSEGTETRGFVVKSDYEGTILEASGRLAPRDLDAMIKYKESEITLTARRLNDGFELGAQLSPHERFSFYVIYSMEREGSFNLGLETPFKGWEKQDVRFSYSLKDQVQGQVSITWGNVHHVTLTLDINEYSMKSFIGKVSFSSTFIDFERFEFIIKHSMSRDVIRTTVSCNWNSETTKGSLDAYPTERGYACNLNFKSPFTEDFSFLFEHQMTYKGLATSLHITYGLRISKILIEGNVSDSENINGSFICMSPFLPEITITAEMQTSATRKSFDVKGKYNNQKAIFLTSYEKYETNEESICSVRIKCVASSTNLFVASFTNKINVRNEIETDIEVASMLISDQSFKGHIEGNIPSIKSVLITGYISGPRLRGLVNITHKFANKKFESKMTAEVNSFTMELALGGNINMATKEGSVHGQIESSLSFFDGYNILIRHNTENNERETFATFNKNESSIKLFHKILFENAYNWRNSLNVSDRYFLTSEMVSVDNDIKHETKIFSGERSFSFELYGRYSDRLDVTSSLSTPWTPVMHLSFIREEEESKMKNLLKVEYGNAINIVANCDYEFKPNSKHILVSILSQSWKLPFSLEINVEDNTGQTVQFTLKLNRIVSVLHLFKNEEMNGGNFSVKFFKGEHPVSVLGKYSSSPGKKNGYLEIYLEQKYSLNVTLTGDKNEGTLLSELQIPLYFKETLKVNVTYMIQNLPVHITTVSMLGSKRYRFETLIDLNRILLDFSSPFRKGSFDMNWLATHLAKEVNVSFISPFNFVKDANLAINSKFTDKSARSYVFDLIYDTHKVHFEGEINDHSIDLRSDTTFSDWRTLSLRVDYTDASMDGILLINEKILKFSGSGAFDISDGEGKLTFKLGDQQQNEDNYLYIKYSVNNDIFDAKLKYKIGVSRFILNADSTASDTYPKKMQFSIESNWETAEKITLEAEFEQSSLQIVGQINNYKFECSLDFKFPALKVGDIKFFMTSNIKEWSTFSFQTKVNLSQLPYIISTEIEREGVALNYLFSLDFARNNFNIEIKTPILFAKNIKVYGTYLYKNSKFESSFQFTKNLENYSVTGYIDFSHIIPNIKINILTPLLAYEEINFELNGTLISECSFSSNLLLGRDLYEVNIYANLDKTTGSTLLKVDLPVDGLRDTIVKISYDLESKTKHASFEMESDRLRLLYSVEGKVFSDEFAFGIETWHESFRKIRATGRYENFQGEVIVQGKVVVNSEVYLFEGKITQVDHGHEIKAIFPTTSGDSFVVNGHVTKEEITISYLRGTVKREISLQYVLGPNNAVLKLNTFLNHPVYISIGGDYEISGNAVKCNVFLHKNDKHFDMEGFVDFSPYKSTLQIELNAPLSSKYSAHIFYDFISKKKRFGFITEAENKVHTYLIEANFGDTNHGSLELTTPFPEYSFNGFEYKFNAVNARDMEVFVSLFRNSESFTLGVQSKLSSNEVCLKFRTPFAGYETYGIEGKVDDKLTEGQLEILFGGYRFFFETNFRPDNIILHVETPFDAFKIFKISSRFGVSSPKKYISLEFIYGESKYALNGSAQFQNENFELNFMIISPFEFLRLVEINGKINFLSRSELLDFTVNMNEIRYFLAVGYQLENLKAALKIDMASPFSGWENAKFNFKIDLQNDNKVLDVSLDKEGVVKSMFLSGKLTDDDLDFNIEMPTFSNFKTKGTLKRSKRSTGFVNDKSADTIVESFNSLKITASTPFKKAKDVYLEIVKERNGGFSLNYKRNNNKVFLNLTVEKRRKGFSVTIESETPGWEFLVLAGRLDLEDAIAYIKAQKNSEMVKLSGSGLLGDRIGSLTVTATSSFEIYREVITKLEYNSKRKIFTFDSQSKSSNYKIIIEFKRGLFIDVFIPHSGENTIAKGKLSFFKGSLNISSRFPVIRTFSINYEVVLAQKITATAAFERNGIKFFELEAERDSQANTAHIMIHRRRGENHSIIHFHREGWTKLEFSFQRNNKEFKVDIDGSGSLPDRGKLQFSISNSFREIPRTVSGALDVERTSSPKKLTLQVNWHDGRQFDFLLQYNASLQNVRKGDFTLKTTTNRGMLPWKNISGNWNFNKRNDGKAFLKVDEREYTISGKIGILESNLVVESNRLPERHIYQWKFSASKNSRDYFIKLGSESRYAMFKLKGTFDTIFNGDITGAFRFSRFMKNDFQYTAKWSRSEEGLSGGGTFEVGKYSGTHTLKNFKRNANDRSASFHWEATSNVQNFRKVTLLGEYSLTRRMIDIKLSWDSDELSIKGALNNVTAIKSENTIRFHIPKIGDGELTLSHDFTNPLSKSAKVLGYAGSREISYVANWTRNKQLTLFDFNAEVQSPIFFGNSNLHAKFDVRDSNKSEASLEYRSARGRQLTVTWSKLGTSTGFAEDLVINTNIGPVSSARSYVNIDFSRDFTLRYGIQWNEKVIEANLKIGSKHTTASITTPFEKFGSINVTIDYDLKKAKSKTVYLKYTRGDSVVEVDFNLKLVNKKTGSLKLSLLSPFEKLRTLSLDANWKKGKFNAVYKRNDVVVNLNGTAEVRTDKSSFNIRFTTPSMEPIHIEFAYDLEGFIKGTGKSSKDLIRAKISIRNHRIDINVKGYRIKEEKIYLELTGTTTIGPITNFSVKLDSELNLINREGLLEVRLNDFYLKIRNTFEKRERGFYARSQIESSLTDLPGITIGLGRDGNAFIFTTGYGDEREISFTFEGKDGFKRGFFGSIDIPRKGLQQEFSVDYNFNSDDELNVNIQITVSEGQRIEIEILYNSDGVKTRLITPWTSLQRLRLRRSVSDNHFLADIGMENYGFAINGYINKNFFKKGFKIEGEMFGKKLSVDGLFRANSFKDLEGRLLILTPFEQYERLGGLFVAKFSSQRFHSEIDVSMWQRIIATADVDLRNKIKGSALLKWNEMLYEVQLDFTANEYDIMKGNLIIRTPHPTFEIISVEGNINANSLENIQAAFVIDHATGPYNLNIGAKIDEPLYFIDIQLNYSNNEYRLVSTNSLIRSAFCLEGNSAFYSKGQKVFHSKWKINYKSKNYVQVAYEAIYGDNLFESSVSVMKNQIEGKLLGRFYQHLFQANLYINAGFHSSLIKANYELDQHQVVTLKIKTEQNFREINIVINPPDLVRFSFELSSEKEQSFNIKTAVEITRRLIKFSLQYASHLEVTTFQEKLSAELGLPIFANNCSTYLEYRRSPAIGNISVKCKCGEIVHILNAKYENFISAYKFIIGLESPLLRGGKGKVLVSYDYSNFVKISIDSLIEGYVNSLYLDINCNYAVIFSCVSPFVPTGMIKLEEKLIFSNYEPVQFKLLYRDSYKTISADGRMSWNDGKKIEMQLNLRTPIKEYKNIDFGINYVKGSPSAVSQLVIYALPFSIRIESYFGSTDVDNSFKAGVEVKTGSKIYEFTKIDVIVPLKKFEPSFSAVFAGKLYELTGKAEENAFGGEYFLRTKNLFKSLPSAVAVSYRTSAPYKFNLDILNSHYSIHKKFGVMFDSSFLLLKDYVKLWLMM